VQGERGKICFTPWMWESGGGGGMLGDVGHAVVLYLCPSNTRKCGSVGLSNQAFM
jgi:hypothetical protein